MAINPPVDATKTPEWAALQKHYDELQSEGISLKQWFADDAERVEKLSFDAGDLHFDLSKNLDVYKRQVLRCVNCLQSLATILRHFPRLSYVIQACKHV